MNQLATIQDVRGILDELNTSSERRAEYVKFQTEADSVQNIILHSKQSPMTPKRVDVSYKDFDSTAKLFQNIQSEEHTINLMDSELEIIEHDGKSILFIDNIPVHPKSGINSLASMIHFNTGTFKRVQPKTKKEILNDLKQDKALHVRIIKNAKCNELPDIPSSSVIKGFYRDNVST